MVVRVLPASKGGIYSNTGSSGHLVDYLEHEAREEKQSDRSIFFNQYREGIKPEEVREGIDGNIKGVQKNKPLFHSLVISPSQDELRHLNGNPDKLTQYTRQVMENYAATFYHKRKEPLESNDLVWYATIHRSRHYSGLDDAVQMGQAQPRQRKAGEQTHIHIVVSARDKTMSRSLHPDAGSSRFNYKAWQQRNHLDFEQSFGYKSIVTVKQHQERLEKQVARLNRVGVSLDAERIKSIGQMNTYSTDFWKGMNQIERGVKQGTIFTANQVYERLGNLTGAAGDKDTQQKKGGERGIDSRQSNMEHQGSSVLKRSQTFSETAVPVSTGSKYTRAEPEGSHSLARTPGSGAAKKSTNVQQKDKPGSVDLTPLISSLRFESVPETGQQARLQEEEYNRRLKRRR